MAPLLGGLGGLLGGHLFVLVGGILGSEEQLSARTRSGWWCISASYDAILAPLVFPLVGWALHEPRTANRVRGGGWDA